MFITEFFIREFLLSIWEFVLFIREFLLFIREFYCLSEFFIYCLSVEMLLFIRKHFLARLCILSSCNSCLTRDYLQLFCFLVEPQQSELHPHHHGHIHPEVRGAAGCIHSHLTDQLPQVHGPATSGISNLAATSGIWTIAAASNIFTLAATSGILILAALSRKLYSISNLAATSGLSNPCSYLKLPQLGVNRKPLSTR